MIHPNFIIIYVDNPLKSADFYSALLGKLPQESHPTFVSFALDSGITFGLWSKHTAEPAAVTTGSGGEIAFAVKDKETVDSMYTQWTQQEARVKQKPNYMDFGYTFVVLDPDGHRLRVFCPQD